MTIYLTNIHEYIKRYIEVNFDINCSTETQKIIEPGRNQIKDSITIKPRTWNISQPLNITGNLKLEQGTNLIFKKDSYLIVKGSPEAIIILLPYYCMT